MSFRQSAPLELGPGPAERPVSIVFPFLGTLETAAAVHYFVDMLGVVRPVGCNMQRSAWSQPVCNEVQKRRLNDATLVMALLGPWIGEVEIHARQRGRPDLVCEYLDRVMPDQPQIRHACVPRSQQAMTYTGLVHLDADEVGVLALCGLLDQRLAIAETDLQDDGRVTPEHGPEFER